MGLWWKERHRDIPIPPTVAATGRMDGELLAEMIACAGAGDAVAMANLGAHLFQSGDRSRGIEWTEHAWLAGNVMAGFNLGTFYEQIGDTHRADLVWGAAGRRGDVDAMMSVARLALRRDDRAAGDVWIDPVISQNDPYPVTALGVAYRVYGDVDTALRLFARGIELGDGYAMEYAADLYESAGDRDRAAELRTRATHSVHYGFGQVAPESLTA